MGTLLDVVRRTPPLPWQESSGIPWSDPGFSQRMLREHLSQDHDRASRRSEVIDAHVQWIQADLLALRPSRVLDLACGPGLYTSRLAALGHESVGIDFSPASIAYAEEHSPGGCTYRCEDLRSADFGTGFDLVMLIFGEFNAFAPDDARAVLSKAHRTLSAGGTLLAEVHTFDAVRSAAARPPFWFASEQGLFSEQPHVLLQEHAWQDETNTTAIRYFVIDALKGGVQTFIEGRQAYTDEEYRELLAGAGFVEVQFLPSLPGPPDAPTNLVAIVAKKPRGES